MVKRNQPGPCEGEGFLLIHQGRSLPTKGRPLRIQVDMLNRWLLITHSFLKRKKIMFSHCILMTQDLFLWFSCWFFSLMTGDKRGMWVWEVAKWRFRVRNKGHSFFKHHQGPFSSNMTTMRIYVWSGSQWHALCQWLWGMESERRKRKVSGEIIYVTVI